MRQLADLEEVVGHAGHDRAGFVVVEKGEGQPFEMGEQLPTHLRLHIGPHHVPLILHEIAQQHPHEVE